MKTSLQASVVSLVGLFAATSFADIVHTTEPGTYVGETAQPTNTPFTDFECAGSVTVMGTSIALPLSAKDGNGHFPYGTVTLDLGKTGSYHGTVTLPPRKVAPPVYVFDEKTERPETTYYRTAKKVDVDVDTVEIAGGAHGLLIKVRYPTGEPTPNDDYAKGGCMRLLINQAALKASSGGKSKWDGTYWAKTGSGGGYFGGSIPAAAISGGKITMMSLHGYHGLIVDQAPLRPDGTFSVKLKVPKPPGKDALAAAFYEDSYIAEFKNDLTFTISGKVTGATDAATSKKGLELDVTFEDGIDSDRSTTELFHSGFNTSTSIVLDCSKLSLAERKLHGSCMER